MMAKMMPGSSLPEVRNVPAQTMRTVISGIQGEDFLVFMTHLLQDGYKKFTRETPNWQAESEEGGLQRTGDCAILQNTGKQATGRKEGTRP